MSVVRNSRTGTRRTETSKYAEEKRTIVIPLVLAKENGIGQTESLRGNVVYGLGHRTITQNRIALESETVEGESPVDVTVITLRCPRVAGLGNVS